MLRRLKVSGGYVSFATWRCLDYFIEGIRHIRESLKLFCIILRLAYVCAVVIYYIPTNVISLDIVDFTECDPMLRITTLWFSESISPLSETDDVVHNVFLYTQCMRYCDVIHIAPNKLYLFQNEAYNSYS